MHWYKSEDGGAENPLGQEANKWVAQFAPLVMESKPLNAKQVKERLATIEKLKIVGPELQTRLEGDNTCDPELTQTLSSALAQLDSIEQDLRRTLAKLSPGDSGGVVDLDVLQDRLAERAARQEVGATNDVLPEVYQATLSRGSWAGAAAIGVFGFGWTAFTTLHAVLMIGGMFKTFGWIALAMLAFYSIFFAVGFAMLYGAFSLLCDQKLRIEGRRLTVTRCLAGKEWSKSYTLSPHSRVSVIKGAGTAIRQQNTVQRSLSIADETGRQVTFGTAILDPTSRDNFVREINAYLAQQ